MKFDVYLSSMKESDFVIEKCYNKKRKNHQGRNTILPRNRNRG